MHSRNRPGARELVYRRLAEQAATYPELLIAPFQTPGLDERDAALAHAIHEVAIRHWLTLGWIIGEFTRQPMRSLEPAMQGVLLGGAAQLLYFDRIPVHAALNETVDLAKQLVRPGAAGMANAVLRRISALVEGHTPRPDDWADRRDLVPTADERALRFTRDVLPEEALERLAISTSHPHGLIKRWATLHARKPLQALLLHTLASPPTILNTAHAALPLPAMLRPHAAPGHHIFEGSRAELLAILESRDDLWVQDSASSRAIAAIAGLLPAPELIIDACAGQGTKTRQLARTFPNARIIATDIDPKRHRTLSDVFRSPPATGQSAQVEVIAPDQLRSRAFGKADLVLLDVPCSNTGVLARRPEARYRTGREQMERLREIQQQIIRDAVPLLSSGPNGRRGQILYSTCSIDREENEFVADWATQDLGLKVARHELLLPAGLPGEDPRHYRDGSFFALLR